MADKVDMSDYDTKLVDMCVARFGLVIGEFGAALDDWVAAVEAEKVDVGARVRLEIALADASALTGMVTMRIDKYEVDDENELTPDNGDVEKALLQYVDYVGRITEHVQPIDREGELAEMLPKLPAEMLFEWNRREGLAEVYANTVKRAALHLGKASELFEKYKQSILDNLGEKLTEDVEVDDNINAEYAYHRDMADEISDELEVMRDFFEETMDSEAVFGFLKGVRPNIDLEKMELEGARTIVVGLINTDIVNLCSGIKAIIDEQMVFLNEHSVRSHDETVDKSYV